MLPHLLRSQLPPGLSTCQMSEKKKHINYTIHSSIKTSGPLRSSMKVSRTSLNKSCLWIIWITLSVNTIRQDHSLMVQI